jgi:hypothetical protein
VEYIGEWRHKFYVDVSTLNFDYTIAVLNSKTGEIRWERDAWRTFSLDPEFFLSGKDVNRSSRSKTWHKRSPGHGVLRVGQEAHPEEPQYKISRKGTYRKLDKKPFQSKLAIQRFMDSYYIGPMIFSKEEAQFLKQKNVKALLNLTTPESMERMGYDEKVLLNSCRDSGIKVLNFPIEESQDISQVATALVRKLQYILKTQGQLYIQSSNELGLGMIVASFLCREDTLSPLML